MAQMRLHLTMPTLFAYVILCVCLSASQASALVAPLMPIKTFQVLPSSVPSASGDLVPKTPEEGAFPKSTELPLVPLVAAASSSSEESSSEEPVKPAMTPLVVSEQQQQ